MHLSTQTSHSGPINVKCACLILHESTLFLIFIDLEDDLGLKESHVYTKISNSFFMASFTRLTKYRIGCYMAQMSVKGICR